MSSQININKHLVSKLLGTWIEKHKKSVTEFAELTSISTSYAYSLLNGNRNPSKKVATKIEKITGIPKLTLLYPEEQNHEKGDAA